MHIDQPVVRSTGLQCRTVDGVTLVADAWHPADGQWPVLLQRLPYGRAVASTPVLPHPTWFARQGYAVIVQDCRGRGESGGRFTPFVDEGADGAASIEWAARLPFCDGRVATYGFSYQGLAQLYAAAQRPPSLYAIAPMMCCPDPYEGWTYEGGLLRWPFVCFWAAQLAGQEQGRGPIPFDVGAIPAAAALGADPPPWLTEWITHPVFDDYWESRRPDLDAIGVPAFTVLGWFDDFSSGTAQLITRLGAEAWCGPWAHMPWGTRHGGVELGPAASPAPVWDALVAFFDRVFGRLPDVPVPARVRCFVLGAGWCALPEWPPAHVPLTLFGHSPTGNANSRWGDGVLLESASEPAIDVPSVLVSELLVPYPGGPVAFEDESATQDRRDVLCFTSAPFAAPTVFAGAPVVEATTASDRPGGHDLIATLHVVDPDGTARAVSGSGGRRAAEPDEALSWRLELRPVAVALAPGQRLRLALSATRFPCYDRRGEVNTVTVASVRLVMPVLQDELFLKSV